MQGYLKTRAAYRLISELKRNRSCSDSLHTHDSEWKWLFFTYALALKAGVDIVDVAI